ncbi:Uncharacterized protein FWK35_00003682 [Aphis craccivora]|uniref:Uncharacterized protein n=1 Tax=Aphis craccivora TaxID=307492 RepID=A0A6G0ZDL9_APHCR|nr:Uncharacterized protein FWK35_00003682 [Aphis craccivora]
MSHRVVSTILFTKCCCSSLQKQKTRVTSRREKIDLLNMINLQSLCLWLTTVVLVVSGQYYINPQVQVPSKPYPYAYQYYNKAPVSAEIVIPPTTRYLTGYDVLHSYEPVEKHGYKYSY